MKTLFAVAVAVPLLFGCAGERTSTESTQQAVIATTDAPEVSHETYTLGTDLTAEGAIPKEAASDMFARGGEVFLSVDVEGASTDQLVEVRWTSPNGEVIRQDEQHVPQSARYVSFSSGSTESWRTGGHTAVVVIDGRRVAEIPFDVQDAGNRDK